MSLVIEPVVGVPEIVPGDDLADVLAGPLRRAGAADGDVVVVTQKVVSKAEGRIVEDVDRAAAIEDETVRVVARRHDLTIAETRHGFVCANAGVDASNVGPGLLTLLPEDPDASARRLRERLAVRLGLPAISVIITDTFGRPWRLGLVDVAIGVAGMPALEDLRGRADHSGRMLEATLVARADQVAAGAGMVMGKDARVPVALVRGLEPDDRDGRAADLVRAPAEDLFFESALQSLHARRTIRSFGPGAVGRAEVQEAISAACAAPAPHHTRPWAFVGIDGPVARRAFLSVLASAWRADLRGDGVPDAEIERRLAASDRVLGQAPTLIVPFVRTDLAHRYPDAERASAERDMFVLSGGAAIQNLLLALHDLRIASCWVSSTLFCQQETRAALGMEEPWVPLGAIACGPMPSGPSPPPRPAIDPDVLRWIDEAHGFAPRSDEPGSNTL